MGASQKEMEDGRWEIGNGTERMRPEVGEVDLNFAVKTFLQLEGCARRIEGRAGGKDQIGSRKVSAFDFLFGDANKPGTPDPV